MVWGAEQAQGVYHDPVVRVQERRVDSEVGGGARERLHVNPPLLRVQIERLQGPLLAEELALIDELVAPVVPSRKRENSDFFPEKWGSMGWGFVPLSREPL